MSNAIKALVNYFSGRDVAGHSLGMALHAQDKMLADDFFTTRKAFGIDGWATPKDCEKAIKKALDDGDTFVFDDTCEHEWSHGEAASSASLAASSWCKKCERSAFDIERNAIRLAEMAKRAAAAVSAVRPKADGEEYTAKSLSEVADYFDILASDQLGSIRMQRTKRGKEECRLKAATYTDVAETLRKTRITG